MSVYVWLYSNRDGIKNCGEYSFIFNTIKPNYCCNNDIIFMTVFHSCRCRCAWIVLFLTISNFRLPIKSKFAMLFHSTNGMFHSFMNSYIIADVLSHFAFHSLCIFCLIFNFFPTNDDLSYCHATACVLVETTVTFTN